MQEKRTVIKLEEGSIFEKGYGMIPKLVMIDKDLDTTDKALYALLCSYAGNGTEAYPSVSRICGDLNIHKDTFYRHLKNLIKKDYVRKKKNFDDSKKFANNIYEIVIFPVPNYTETGFTETENVETNSINPNSINPNSIIKNITSADTEENAFIKMKSLKSQDIVKQVNTLISSNRTKISLLNYQLAKEKINKVIDDLGADSLFECINRYSMDHKQSNRSLEHFVKVMHRYLNE